MGRELNDTSRYELPQLMCPEPRPQPTLDLRVPKEAITSRDVLLGRSNCSTKHVGTIAFRAFIASRLELYKKAISKSSKTHQIVSVVNSVHEAGGRFMVDVGFGLWWSEVDRRYARVKVCNTFRDAVRQLDNGKQRVWGESARFPEAETFASIVDYVEKEMSKEAEYETSDAESTSFREERSIDSSVHSSEELSLVETKTESVERSQGMSLFQALSPTPLLNGLFDTNNGEREGLDEEFVRFQSSLSKATIEEMKEHLRNIEDDKYVHYDEGRNEACLSQYQGLTTAAFAMSDQKNPPLLGPVILQHEIRSQDILMGRRRSCEMHVGNIAFRSLIEAHLPSYQATSARASKSQVILEVFNAVEETGGRFLFPTVSSLTAWAEVDRSYARAKIGNSFRDAKKQSMKGDNTPCKYPKETPFSVILSDVSCTLGTTMQAHF
jgi:hypothetical protein